MSGHDHDQEQDAEAVDVARDALTLEGQAEPLSDPPAIPQRPVQLPLADFGPAPMPGQTDLGV